MKARRILASTVFLLLSVSAEGKVVYRAEKAECRSFTDTPTGAGSVISSCRPSPGTRVRTGAHGALSFRVFGVTPITTQNSPEAGDARWAAGCISHRGARASWPIDPYFSDVQPLTLAATEILARAGIAKPCLYGPSSRRGRHSYYIFGLGKLTEVRLESGKVLTHPIPFDRDSTELYDAGVGSAWLGPDLKIYFGLAGKPARLGCFDPETREMKLLGDLQGHTVMRHIWGPSGKCYTITYPATLCELDIKTGQIRHLGRLTADGLYVWGPLKVGKDGWFYCTSGQRPARKVRMNLTSGERQLLEAFPAIEEAEKPAIDFPDLSQRYPVNLTTDGDEATLVISPEEGLGPPRAARFRCSTVPRDMLTVARGPDGRIYASGSYEQGILDPRTGRLTRPKFRLSTYDYLTVGKRLFLCGYPNARVAVLDPFKPIHTGGKAAIWEMKDAAIYNPYQLICIYDIEASGEKLTAGKLAMKRCWAMAMGADGKVYVGNSGSRQNWGGALVGLSPDTGEAQVIREPHFRFLAIHAVCAVDDGALIGVATVVSPDPTAPGQEPAAARIFLYDVAKGEIVHEAVPMPDHKLLVGLRQAPGTRVLVGIGLRDTEPSPEADNHYTGDGELFFYDLDARKTVKRVPLSFPLDRRVGNPIVPAPDGTLWVCGGGGLIRIDAAALTVAPLATVGANGNFIFDGDTIYMVGTARIRHGSVAHLLLNREK